jgi:MFS family permease
MGSGASPQVLDPKRANAVLIVLAVIALMVTYVETMIIPGLETFRTFFDNAPISTVAWILTAYLLVGVVATPIVGKLGDIYGKKRMLVIVLVIYAIAVTVAGFTPNIGDALGIPRGNQIYLLIGVRAVQGIGVAMFPLAFAMIGEEFPRPQIARAQGLVSGMFAAGAAIGLFGGAAVTQAFGWQATYHTVIPVAIGALIAAIVLLPESRIRLEETLDYIGAALLGASLAFGIVGLTQAPSWGWGNWSAITVGGLPFGSPECFLIAAILAALFIVRERRIAKPIVDFAKMAERNIWVSNATGMLAGTAMFMFFVGLTYLAELPIVGFGFTPLQFGEMSLPATFANMISAPLVGRWIGLRGPKPAMMLGGVLVAISGFSLVFLNDQWYYLVGASIPLFLGVIMIFIAMTNTVVTSSRPKEVGIQTGMNQTFRNLGTTLGPAIAATILTSFTAVYFIDVGGGVLVPTAPLPTLDAFRYVFGAIGALGVGMIALTSLIRNFRFAADGTRQSLERGPAAPSGATPGAAPSDIGASRPEG